MLKYWLAILLVLNAVVLAWQWDAFARWGHGPNLQREPERLQQQVRPDALKFEIMPPASASATAEPAAVEANGQATALPLDASASDAARLAPTLPAPASAAPPSAPQ